MACIPDTELERLKREVSLLRLLENHGHTLIRQGKDWACRCPWHAGDDTPSCVITVKSNLWHCFGCDAGGSVIDWVMRASRVSFRLGILRESGHEHFNGSLVVPVPDEAGHVVEVYARKITDISRW